MNTKKITQAGKWIMVLCCTGLLFASCLQPDHLGKLHDNKAVDSLLRSHYDSIFTHPAEMELRFNKAQEKLSDSTAFYKLELFKGYCRYLQGDFDSAIITN